MEQEIQRLEAKVADLTYRVESFCSLGDERLLESLRADLERLRTRRQEKRAIRRYLSLVA